MLTAFIQRAVVQGIPLLFGSTGEIITEKSGNLNLGIPGIMYVGGICGVIGAFLYERSVPAGAAVNPFLAVLIPLVCCMIGSLLVELVEMQGSVAVWIRKRNIAVRWVLYYALALAILFFAAFGKSAFIYQNY